MKLSSVRVSIEEQWKGEGKERNVGGARFIGKSENGFAQIRAAIAYLKGLLNLGDEDAKWGRVAAWDQAQEVFRAKRFKRRLSEPPMPPKVKP